MTAGELIAELQKHPPDMPVCVERELWDGDDWGFSEIQEVRRVERAHYAPEGPFLHLTN